MSRNDGSVAGLVGKIAFISATSSVSRSSLQNGLQDASSTRTRRTSTDCSAQMEWSLISGWSAELRSVWQLRAVSLARWRFLSLLPTLRSARLAHLGWAGRLARLAKSAHRKWHATLGRPVSRRRQDRGSTASCRHRWTRPRLGIGRSPASDRHKRARSQEPASRCWRPSFMFGEAVLGILQDGRGPAASTAKASLHCRGHCSHGQSLQGRGHWRLRRCAVHKLQRVCSSPLSRVLAA
mmetsp:Transcript_7634/g.21504  ORF Transcript_7634/g.21504 Transcript_7634/m.21504 type:complete len:238 (+) Transcript_7634:132-845(+)